jgi:hypothetical protein
MTALSFALRLRPLVNRLGGNIAQFLFKVPVQNADNILFYLAERMSELKSGFYVIQRPVFYKPLPCRLRKVSGDLW